MAYKKVPMTSIKTLTFHSDTQTGARRTAPIPQLTCIGKACETYQPEVVQCTNMGDDGIGNVQWRCDTDLPTGFRLGKVEVSCEGWSRPGDKHVLQGSCGLEYNLHRSRPGLFDNHPTIKKKSSLDIIVNTLFWMIILVLGYNLVRSLLRRLAPRWAPPPPSTFFPWRGGGGGGPPGGGGGGGGGWGGWPGWGPGPGFQPGPPPPYTKDPYRDVPGGSSGSMPGTGFWTGLAAGGAAGYLAARRGGDERSRQRPVGGGYRMQRVTRETFERDDDDRGEGPSRAQGQMRPATGFGGTNVR